MTIETDATRGVKNYYGTRSTDEARVSGEISNSGGSHVLEVAFRAKDDQYLLVSGTIPAGSVIRETIVEIKEAFAVGGTTPTINLGTDGSAATNGVPISEAQAEAIGVYAPAAGGTWAQGAVLAADTAIAIELGGTSPTLTEVGHAVVKVFYDNMS